MQTTYTALTPDAVNCTGVMLNSTFGRQMPLLSCCQQVNLECKHMIFVAVIIHPRTPRLYRYSSSSNTGEVLWGGLYHSANHNLMGKVSHLICWQLQKVLTAIWFTLMVSFEGNLAPERIVK